MKTAVLILAAVTIVALFAMNSTIYHNFIDLKIEKADNLSAFQQLADVRRRRI